VLDDIFNVMEIRLAVENLTQDQRKQRW
jgi:hypothetical protein